VLLSEVDRAVRRSLLVDAFTPPEPCQHRPTSTAAAHTTTGAPSPGGEPPATSASPLAGRATFDGVAQEEVEADREELSEEEVFTTPLLLLQVCCPFAPSDISMSTCLQPDGSNIFAKWLCMCQCCCRGCQCSGDRANDGFYVRLVFSSWHVGFVHGRDSSDSEVQGSKRGEASCSSA
jgi:hypothetical protein